MHTRLKESFTAVPNTLSRILERNGPPDLITHYGLTQTRHALQEPDAPASRALNPHHYFGTWTCEM